MNKPLYTYQSIALMRNSQRDPNGNPVERIEGDGKHKCLQCKGTIHESQMALKTKSGKHLHAKVNSCKESESKAHQKKEKTLEKTLD